MRAAVQLLGRFDLRASAGQSVKVPAGKVCALFAALAVAPNHRQSREALLTLFWGDYPEQQARGSLRFALTVLRKALAHSECLSLCTNKDAVWFDARSFHVDAVEFEKLAKMDNTAELQKAVDLYQGDFLEGVTVRCEQFEDWVRAHRIRLRNLFEDALDRLLTCAQASGQDELSIQIAQRLLTLDPLREDIHRLLIANHLRHRRKGAALKQYELCAEVLRNDLNTQPDLETNRLIERLRPKPTPVMTRPMAPQTAPASCQILFQSLRAECGGKLDNELTTLLEESIRFALARLSDFKIVIPPPRRRDNGRNAADSWTAGAGFVVNGVVKMRDAKVEATIYLAETPSSSHFWARQYLLVPPDLEKLDAFAARTIVPPIHHALQQKQLEFLRRASARELDGFQLGLLARAELEKLNRASLNAAVGLARRARQNGAISSLSCSMLALARVFQIRMGWADNRSGALAEALEAAEQALSLEFNNPLAHGVLGLVHLWRGSHTLALNSANHAVTLSPRADVIHWKGLVLDFTGKHEQAIEHHLAALDLDPLHGAAFATINALFRSYYELGAYEQAAAWASKSIKVNPHYRRGHAVLAASLAQMGDGRGCTSALKSARILDPSLSLKMQLSAFPYKNTSEILAWERGFRKAGLR